MEAAEIAKFTPEEKGQYEESLKTYRDLKNVIDTPFSDGEIKGKIKGKIEGKIEGIMNALKQGTLTPDDIAEIFTITLDFVLKIKAEHNLCPPSV